MAMGGSLYRDLDSKGLRNNLYKHLITEAGAEPSVVTGSETA